MRRWMAIVLLVILVLLPGGVSQAQGPIPGGDGGRVFVDEDVSLRPGETFEGDLGVLRGNLELPEGSVVNGDVFVMGGHAKVLGQVNGNLAVIGGRLDQGAGSLSRGDVLATGGQHEVGGQVQGNLSVLFGDVTLHSTALILGDLVVVPGHLQQEGGAQVRGKVVTSTGTRSGSIVETPPAGVPEVTPPPVPSVPQIQTEVAGHRVGRFLIRVAQAILLLLVSVGVGMGISWAWPRPVRRASECIGKMPLQSMGLGLLMFLLAAALEAVAAVLMILIILVAAMLIGTVILIPFGALMILLSGLVLLPVPLALAAAIMLGWVSLAHRIGDRILHGLGARQVVRWGATLVGLLIMAAIGGLLWIIQPACCGWPFFFLLSSFGLGAVFHTGFGRKECQPDVSAAGDTSSEAATGLLPAEAMAMEAGQPDQAPIDIP